MLRKFAEASDSCFFAFAPLKQLPGAGRHRDRGVPQTFVVRPAAHCPVFSGQSKETLARLPENTHGYRLESVSVDAEGISRANDSP